MATLRMKAVLPKRVNFDAAMAELTKEMKDIHKDVDKDFGATVKTWEHGVRFDKEFESGRSRIRFFTGTSDEIYGYVSGGTRPHRIVPKRARVLAFPGTYTAKTAPGVIGSSSGGSSGETVYSKGVMHPGTKARNFPEAIEKKWRSPFPRRMKAAMGRAVKKSGHSI